MKADIITAVLKALPDAAAVTGRDALIALRSQYKADSIEGLILDSVLTEGKPAAIRDILSAKAKGGLKHDA